MKHTKGTLIGQRSIKLAYAAWLPDVPPHALVVLVHGYGEHAGRYKLVIESLVARGYAVYTIDHRGHGESEGVRAHVERFEYFVDDLRQLVDQASAAHRDLPLFMIGHSMGGLIATRYALRYQQELHGLVLSGPALVVGDDVSAGLKRVSGILARLAPTLALTPATASPESVLSRDPIVQELFDNDPLCYKGKVRARLGHELMLAGARTRAHLAELTVPLLVMYGTDDKLVNPSGALQVYEQASSADKTIKAWPGCRHEIFHEPEKHDVIAYMLDWLAAHLPHAAAPLAAPATLTR